MRYFLVLSFTLFLFSCSADIDTPEQKAGKQPSEQSKLVGTWDAKELQVNESQATEEEIYAKGVLDYLDRTGCVVLSFTFNADGSMETQSKAAYIDASFGPGGLSIPCPEEMDTEQATYSLEEGVLTITESGGGTLSVATTIEDGLLYMSAADLEVEGLNTNGTLVLVKR